MCLDIFSDPGRKPREGWWRRAVQLPSFQQFVSAARSWRRASLILTSFLTPSSIPVATSDDISGNHRGDRIPPEARSVAPSYRLSRLLLNSQCVEAPSIISFECFFCSLQRIFADDEHILDIWTEKASPPFLSLLCPPEFFHPWLLFIHRIIKSESKKKINPFMFCDLEALRCCKEWKHLFYIRLQNVNMFHSIREWKLEAWWCKELDNRPPDMLSLRSRPH